MSTDLILIHGLPASGKTWLSKQLLNYLTITYNNNNTIVCYNIEYDHIFNLISSSTSKNINHHHQSITNTTTNWKVVRQEILYQIELLVCNNSNKSSTLESFLILPRFQPTIILQPQTTDNNAQTNNVNTIFLIDDNLYYKSMRYQFYKIAKQYNTRFTQVYLYKDLYLSKLNNSQRQQQHNLIINNINNSFDNELRVTDTIIEKMNEIFEEPQPQTHRWEQNTVVIPTINFINDTFKSISVESIWKEIVNSLNRPILDDTIEKQHQQQLKDNDRMKTKNNTIHQLDLEFRRTVNHLLSEYPEYRERSKLLSNYKRDFLCKLFDYIDSQQQDGISDEDLQHQENGSRDSVMEHLIQRFNSGCLSLLENNQTDS